MNKNSLCSILFLTIEGGSMTFKKNILAFVQLKIIQVIEI